MTTLRQSQHSRFQRGSGVYQCMICKRRTRDTGDGVDHLCHECFELAGMDNHCNDNGVTAEQAGYVAERDRLLSVIATKGGDVQRVIDNNDYLFPTGYKIGAAAPTAPTEAKTKITGKLLTAKQIEAVRKAFENNLADYPRHSACLRETCAEFTAEGDPATWGANSFLHTSAHAAECFPEFNRHTVIDAWNRAVRCWNGNPR